MNTLKFGNGEWYGKEGTILAYNSENNNYKPLPFTFDRDSVATRVNKQGLIETVGADQPRIDYLNDSNGALKLEPSRTNKATYSEDFTQWTDYNASAVLSEETIFGKNAYKIVEDNTTNYHGVYLSNLFTADGTNYIWSAYVKGAERRYVVLTARVGISSNSSALIFDTQEGEWVLDDSSQNEALFAENAGNGWWRIGIEGNPTSGAYDSYTIASAIGFSSYLDANYQGDGTSGFYVAFAQLEAGSYATSYIPTQGSAVTRVADSCNNSGNDQVINSTEGVLYAEISALANDGTVRYFGLNDGSNNNRAIFLFDAAANRVRAIVSSGGTKYVDFYYTVTDLTEFHKIALKYKANDFALWIDGTERNTDTNGLTPIGLDNLEFDLNSGGALYGNVKDVRVYNTALTDQELAALTQV
jgi:hypothetical protein